MVIRAGDQGQARLVVAHGAGGGAGEVRGGDVGRVGDEEVDLRWGFVLLLGLSLGLGLGLVVGVERGEEGRGKDVVLGKG